jgi:hypothetical protein
MVKRSIPIRLTIQSQDRRLIDRDKGLPSKSSSGQESLQKEALAGFTLNLLLQSHSIHSPFPRGRSALAKVCGQAEDLTRKFHHESKKVAKPFV